MVEIRCSPLNPEPSFYMAVSLNTCSYTSWPHLSWPMILALLRQTVEPMSGLMILWFQFVFICIPLRYVTAKWHLTFPAITWIRWPEAILVLRNFYVPYLLTCHYKDLLSWPVGPMVFTHTSSCDSPPHRVLALLVLEAWENVPSDLASLGGFLEYSRSPH